MSYSMKYSRIFCCRRSNALSIMSFDTRILQLSKNFCILQNVTETKSFIKLKKSRKSNSREFQI